MAHNEPARAKKIGQIRDGFNSGETLLARTQFIDQGVVSAPQPPSPCCGVRAATGPTIRSKSAFDADSVVLCFAEPERRGGLRQALRREAVAEGQLAMILKTSWRPEPVVQDERQAVAQPADFAR
jgi:hypothetical protein